MVTTCAASSRLALSAVLRSVFRSQLTSEFGASSILPYHRRFNSCSSLFPRPSQTQRPFSSIPHLRDSRDEQGEHAAPEPAVSVNAASSDSKSERRREQKTTKIFDTPGDKGGWNVHRSQFKGQRPDPEHKSGRTDKERRTFRNETRREAKKQPRDWKAENAKAKEEFEKQKQRKRKPENWQTQKAALKEKFTAGWNPPKKLSPDALDGIRHLHAKAPEQFTTAVLAKEFEMSPEAIRRILKSKWRPSEDEMESRRKRWESRHDRIWSRMAELGLRPSTLKTRPVADYHVLYKEDAD
jgi:hypothetical protein